MKQQISRLAQATFIVIVAFTCLSSAEASSFSATATSTISDITMTPHALIVSHVPPPDGVTLVGPIVSGSGIVSTQTFVNDIGLGTQSAAVAGSAGPGPGSAAAGVEVHDFVEVIAGPSGTSLEFTFGYSVAASVAAMPGEDAAATYNFHITGIGDEFGESLMIDTGGGYVAATEFEVDDIAIASAGDTGFAFSDSVRVKYTVLGDGAAFSIFTRSGGAAIVPVPEPATTWSLIGLGLSFACVQRWRRRRSLSTAD